MERDHSRLVFAALCDSFSLSFPTATYDSAASRYDPAVYHRKRVELVNIIHTTLYPIFDSQLKKVSKCTLTRFKKALKDGLEGKTAYNFTRVVEDAKESGLNQWDKSTKEMLEVVQPDGGEWVRSWEEERGVLSTKLGLVEDEFRKKETMKLVNRIEVRTDLSVHWLLLFDLRLISSPHLVFSTGTAQESR